MAVSDVPEGQRLGALVLRTHEKCASDPQDNDCGAGTQAADRPVAARAGGRDPGGDRPASSFMSGVTKHVSDSSGPPRFKRERWPNGGWGGGGPDPPLWFSCGKKEGARRLGASPP